MVRRLPPSISPRASGGVVRVNVSLDIGALDRLLRRPGGPVYDNVVNRVLVRTDAIATLTAPVDTGFLRNNRSREITSTPSSLKGKLTYHAHYAIYVTKGTRYQRANPFLANAFRAGAAPWPVHIH